MEVVDEDFEIHDLTYEDHDVGDAKPDFSFMGIFIWVAIVLTGLEQFGLRPFRLHTLCFDLDYSQQIVKTTYYGLDHSLQSKTISKS